MYVGEIINLQRSCMFVKIVLPTSFTTIWTANICWKRVSELETLSKIDNSVARRVTYRMWHMTGRHSYKSLDIAVMSDIATNLTVEF